MAKGKKNKSSKNGRTPVKGGSQYTSSDDESAETCSVLSGDSQYPNATDEDNSGPDEVFQLEDKLKEALDEASTSKSAQKRAQHLQVLCKQLTDHYCPEFLSSRPSTMADLVEKSIRKGKGEEQIWAATLAPLLIVQYGASPEGMLVFKTIQKVLTSTMQDKTVPPQIREKLVIALALTAYIAEDDRLELQVILEQLRSIFSGSFLKGDGVTPNVTPLVSSLHQAALLSWSLLLTALYPDMAFTHISRNLNSIIGLLQCTEVDMRVAAGEALVTMYEIARERDPDFDGDDIDKLCEDLHLLATDSQKFRAKKDRKMQKSSFRDIERAIRDGEKPELNVQFGVETLKITIWEDKRMYDALCCVLGSGMNHHLQNNPEVRALFNLGAPLVVNNSSVTKISKFERNQGNQLADRNRTKRMNKARDKRLEIM